MDTNAEWEMIRRCRSGNSAAFEPIVRANEPWALAVAEGFLGDADEAADAVQDAFVKAYRSLSSLREGLPFGPWFRSIVRNHCLDRLRSPERRRVEGGEALTDPRLWSEPTAPAALERAELAAAVRRGLAALSAEHREVLVLKEMEELGYAEIAAALSIPAGTVASRLYHARAALRKVLVAEGFTTEVEP
jgi:RNA polymerase sigma-70 factor, ECF subfamily